MSRSIVHVRRKKKDADPLRSAWHILEDWLEVNRERIVRIGAIALGLVLVVALLYYFLEFREQQRQQAFADAYEKFTATIGAPPAGLPGAAAAKSYPDAQAKYGDAGAAFEAPQLRTADLAGGRNVRHGDNSPRCGRDFAQLRNVRATER